MADMSDLQINCSLNEGNQKEWFKSIQLFNYRSSKSEPVFNIESSIKNLPKLQETPSKEINLNIKERKKIDLSLGVRRAFNSSISRKSRLSQQIINQMWEKEEKFRNWNIKKYNQTLSNQKKSFDNHLIERIHFNRSHPKV